MTEQQQEGRRLELEVFAPALKEAVQKAQAEGYALNDVILAAANAYLNMVVGLIGQDDALTLLENQTTFLRSEIGQ